MVLDLNIEKIDVLIRWAKQNIITEKMLYDIKLGKMVYPESSHIKSKKLDLWYTIEEQPIEGLCHHITLAKTVPLTESQNYKLIAEIFNIFNIPIDDRSQINFEGPKLHIHTKIETDERSESAVKKRDF